MDGLDLACLKVNRPVGKGNAIEEEKQPTHANSDVDSSVVSARMSKTANRHIDKHCLMGVCGGKRFSGKHWYMHPKAHPDVEEPLSGIHFEVCTAGECCARYQSKLSCSFGSVPSRGVPQSWCAPVVVCPSRGVPQSWCAPVVVPQVWCPSCGAPVVVCPNCG